MTVNATTIFSSTSSVLSILAQASSSASQATTNLEVNAIDNRIQDQLDAKIAALQPTPDPAVANATQAQITALKNQVSTITSTGNQYAANTNLLSALQTQLAALQTDAQSGNAAGFDNALAAANNDVGDLAVVTPTAPFQPDQVLPLKGNGLGIGNSASYDLSSPAGQAAASADISAAQTVVGAVFQVTSSNQILATEVTTALSTQVNGLVATQQQQSGENDQSAIEAETLTLTQQAQDQEHVIELALGNTSQLSTALAAITAKTPASTPYTVLQSSVGATVATPQQQGAASIVSLLA